jgi:hypothetical protein
MIILFTDGCMDWRHILVMVLLVHLLAYAHGSVASKELDTGLTVAKTSHPFPSSRSSQPGLTFAKISSSLPITPLLTIKETFKDLDKIAL